MFNDFLAKQPIDVIVKTEITDTKVNLPVNVDSKSFYKEFSAAIENASLTTEKAIFIASQETKKPMTSVQDLLNKKIRF